MGHTKKIFLAELMWLLLVDHVEIILQLLGNLQEDQSLDLMFHRRFLRITITQINLFTRLIGIQELSQFLPKSLETTQTGFRLRFVTKLLITLRTNWFEVCCSGRLSPPFFCANIYTGNQSQMSVRLVLLKSGEEVVADVTQMTVGESQTVVGYYLEEPCAAKIYKTETENQIKLMPWLPLSKEKKVPVPAEWVVTIVEPIDQLLSLYQKSIKKYGKSEDPGFEQPDFTESD